MMFRTHLAFALMLGLIFFRAVDARWFYFPIILATALLPDIDSTRSYLGKKWYFRPLQWFLKHRGLLHSFSFCIVVSFLISFLYPVLAFPFFIGYFSHLFADGITKEGIRPLWPLKNEMAGKIRTGGRIENIFLMIFVAVDLIIIMFLFI